MTEIKISIERAVNRLLFIKEHELQPADKLSFAAINMAIQALERQIPKKPREHYNWVDLTEEERQETARWYCKSCDSAVEESYSYCCNCGQKLDWN